MTDSAGLAWTCSRLSNRRYMIKGACLCTAQVLLGGFHPVLAALCLSCLVQHHVKPQSRASGRAVHALLPLPWRPVSLYGS